MKKTWLKTGAICLATALFASFGAACSHKAEPGDAVTYVSIDVNPAISLALDEKNAVVSVVADNEDAQVLLYGETLIGLDAEDALNLIADLSVDLGFLNDSNTGVDITVEGKASAEEIAGYAEAAFGDEYRVTSEGTFSLQRKLDAVKAEYDGNLAVQNLSLAKFRLILEAQKVDGTLTIVAAAELDTDELIAIVNDAAKKIRPYATAAYEAAVAVAERVYENTKGSLLDKIWITPYLNILKYDVNYGLIYNLYRDSARATAMALDAAETAAEIAKATPVPTSVTDGIATAMGMTEEQKAAFLAEVTEDGKVTVASLDDYFDRYFKNMTADEREAAKELMDAIKEQIQNFAAQADEAVADEYKAAIAKLIDDLNALIPEEIRDATNAYLTEFAGLIEDLTAATDGKDPRAAAYAVLATLEKRGAAIEQTMRNDLTEDDLANVEAAIKAVSDKLENAEQAFADAKLKAEQEAKAFLAQLKQERQTEQAA